jgi:hypothetical protein
VARHRCVERQAAAADREHVTRRESPALAHALAVDARPVVAVEVGDRGHARLETEHGVTPRHGRVVELDLALGRAPDVPRAVAIEQVSPRSSSIGAALNVIVRSGGDSPKSRTFSL